MKDHELVKRLCLGLGCSMCEALGSSSTTTKQQEQQKPLLVCLTKLDFYSLSGSAIMFSRRSAHIMSELLPIFNTFKLIVKSWSNIKSSFNQSKINSF
jgi:hypothetical protein